QTTKQSDDGGRYGTDTGRSSAGSSSESSSTASQASAQRSLLDSASVPDDTVGQAGEASSLLPAITLPEGGGAIRGLGEKFSINAATGAASMTVPIETTPGRAGFGPDLSLTYNASAGNGPYGLGWQLSPSTISRRTDKGLPRYVDAEDSDVFVLAGAEDLVIALTD